MTGDTPARLARFAAPRLKRAWATATDAERQEFIADNFPELALANSLPKSVSLDQMLPLVAAFIRCHRTPTDGDVTGAALDRQRHKMSELLRRLESLVDGA